MKKTKRILSILLTVVMLLTTAPLGVLTLQTAAKTDIPDDAVCFGGNYYKIYQGVCEKWHEAVNYCANLGGHLATISSEEENSFLQNLVTQSGLTFAYFGLTRDTLSGDWEWITFEPIVYLNWAPGEPNNNSFYGEEMYGEFSFNDGTWNDGDFGGSHSGSDQKNFICEWESNIHLSFDEPSYEVTLNEQITAKGSVTSAEALPSDFKITYTVSDKTGVEIVDGSESIHMSSDKKTAEFSVDITGLEFGKYSLTASTGAISTSCEIKVVPEDEIEDFSIGCWDNPSKSIDKYKMNNGLQYLDTDTYPFVEKDIGFFTTVKLITNEELDDPVKRIDYTIDGNLDGIVVTGETEIKYEEKNSENVQYIYALSIPLVAKIEGNYKITVTTDYCKEPKEIEFQVVDIDYRSTIKHPEECRYKFSNESNKVEIDDTVFKAIFGRYKGVVSYITHNYMHEYYLCFGMSVSTAVFAQHKFMINNFEGNTIQSKLERNTFSSSYNMSVLTWLKGVQIAVLNSKNTTDGDIKAIYYQVKNSNVPVPIGARHKEKDKINGYCAHRMLAIGIINNMNSHYNIAIYDPNRPTDTYVLEISKDFKTWKLNASYSYSSENEDHIYALTQESMDWIYDCRYNFVDSAKTRAENEKTYLAENNLLVTSNTPLNSEKLSEIDLSMIEGSTVDDTENTDHMYWAEENLNTLSLTASEATSIDIADVNSGIRADLPKGCTAAVTVDDDGQNTIKYDTKKNEAVSVSFMQADGDDIKEIRIDGVANANEITMTQSGDQIQVNGLSSGTVTLKTNDETTAAKNVNSADGNVKIICVDDSIEIIAKQEQKVRAVKIDNVTIDYKSSTTLKPVITADSGVKYTVKYESSNPSVVTVDKDGKVYGAKKGTAEIKVIVTDENNNTVTDTCKVTVKYSGLQWFIIIVLFGWIWYIK